MYVGSKSTYQFGKKLSSFYAHACGANDASEHFALMNDILERI